ncbi:MAG: M56 family metallopeptidase [Lachnospiraceae bacterium]|nr:M56 family metallopeptidase [Lachnospiraceae bacterium]
MKVLFQEILELSVTGGIVILITLFIRSLLLHVPKFFSYILWSIPAIRLLVPITFTGIWTLIPDIPTKNSHTLQGMATQQGILQRTATVTPYLIGNTQKLPEGTTSQGILDWLPFIWIAGVLFLLCYGIISFVRLQHRLKISIQIEKDIYLVDFLPTGFVIGIIHPKIYLPSNLSEEEQKYIILHEKVHIKRFDYLSMLVAYITLCIHWFNPLVWLGFRMFVQDMEMSCDEKVIRECGTKHKKRYASVMAGIVIKKAHPEMFAMFCGSNIKRRIQNIMVKKNTSKKIKIISVMTVLLMAILFVPNFTKGKSKAQTSKTEVVTGFVLAKDKILVSDGITHKHSGYPCYYKIQNPEDTKYSLEEMETLFTMVMDKWTEDAPFAALPEALYFNQELSDKLAKENSCDLVVQMDFEIPENSEHCRFEPKHYNKYNWYLSKDNTGNWIVR